MELAGSVVVLSGTASEDGNFPVMPGAVWELPEGARAEVLDLVKGNGVSQRLEYLTSVQTSMHELARVPQTAVGVTAGQLSGLALQIQLGPLARLIARKRLYRSSALRTRALLIAALGHQFGLCPSTSTLPAVNWRDAIDTDREMELRNAQAEEALGRDAEAVLRSIGVDDPAAELAARRQQVQRRPHSAQPEYKEQSPVEQETNQPDDAGEAGDEQTIDHAAEAAALRAQLDEAQSGTAAARTELAAAIAATRDAVRAANPTIPPALIDGASVAEMSASVERARDIVAEAVRLGGGNGHAPHVPTGAQTAPAVDTSQMSGTQKIAYALSHRRA